MGGYILKPPAKQYKFLPELEDLRMHLAEISGINVVPHSLIRLSSGKLSYITRRIDRIGNADMHLKNFSLIDIPDMGYILSPAYDMVASALVVAGQKHF